jgi:predicted phosphodiesterase/energy-coupling factor transporter ATP-binding protein EcfA2
MHLSDLHVGGEDWQRDDVLDALVRDLPQLLAGHELRPDLLLVTGDVADSGRREEYDGAFVVLEQITRALGLDRHEHVFMVPGNHDVDRSRISGITSLHHQALVMLGSEGLADALADLLGHADELALYGERLREWCAFTERFMGPARAVTPEHPWRADVVRVQGLSVGVLSLCTAWASGNDHEHGRLLLGERQLRSALAQARGAGARLVVALLHHPPSWLHPAEQAAVRGRIEREVDVLLHGHTHEVHSAVQTAAGSTHATLGAGAAYAGLRQDRYHGFTVCRFEPVGGELEVHHFTWSTRSAKWHLDTGAPGVDEQGRARIRLSAPMPAAVPREREHEGLATRLRTAAANVYATVDFAGLGVAGPRKHVTLEQIFVPLHLEAETPCRSSTLEELLARLLAPSREPSGARVLVLGEPGSGKSMLCRHLATMAASHHDGPVPLLLTVRDWVAHGEREQLLELAARHATEVLSVRTDPEDLGDFLGEQMRVLLLMDGLDEAGEPALRRDLRDRIHGFVASRPRVSIVVTSRIAGYHEVPLNEGFERLVLAPFDDFALARFAERWAALVEDEPHERTRRRVELLHALTVDPCIRTLAGNPLMATLVGLIDGPSETAVDRLHAAIVELLVVTWPAERRSTLAELPGMTQVPLLEALSRQLLALPSAAEGDPHAAVLVDAATLDAMLAALLRERFRGRDRHELRHLARRWGRWLVHDSGLLHEPRPGRVGFAHRSLMEHLAGRTCPDAGSAPPEPSTRPAPRRA